MPKPTGVVVEAGRTYTTRQVCRWLRWNRHTIYRAVHDGRLPVIPGGREWTFLGDDLLQLAKPMNQEPAMRRRAK